jgi:hypothetical protein
MRPSTMTSAAACTMRSVSSAVCPTCTKHRTGIRLQLKIKLAASWEKTLLAKMQTSLHFSIIHTLDSTADSSCTVIRPLWSASYREKIPCKAVTSSLEYVAPPMLLGADAPLSDMLAGVLEKENRATVTDLQRLFSKMYRALAPRILLLMRAC